jgi:hypothetical protein
MLPRASDDGGSRLGWLSLQTANATGDGGVEAPRLARLPRAWLSAAVVRHELSAVRSFVRFWTKCARYQGRGAAGGRFVDLPPLDARAAVLAANAWLWSS